MKFASTGPDPDRDTLTPFALVVLALAAIGLAGVLAFGCYAHSPTPVPSCAEDPTQDWCAGWPPPLQARTDGGRG